MLPEVEGWRLPDKAEPSKQQGSPSNLELSHKCQLAGNSDPFSGGPGPCSKPQFSFIQQILPLTESDAYFPSPYWVPAMILSQQDLAPDYHGGAQT